MQRKNGLESKACHSDENAVLKHRKELRTATHSKFEQPEIVMEPPHGWLNLRLRELWLYHELLYFFIWRDLKVRYKQTLLGAAWAILQPVMTMIVFSIIFGKLANIIPPEGIPYPVFAYAALLPWQLFSGALANASSSLVSNQSMVTKVYFPRILLPLASILSGLVDFGIAFIVLLGLMVYYHITLTWAVLFLPLFTLLALVTAMAVGLWLSAFNVKYRDFKYVVPFLLQFWMYATPIAYPSTLIPEKWRLIFGLNPMAGVVGGFRWALLGMKAEVTPLLFIAIFIVVILLTGGLIYFQRMEQTFADVI
jgi:lipopolysaccharide transport system permease protein